LAETERCNDTETETEMHTETEISAETDTETEIFRSLVRLVNFLILPEELALSGCFLLDSKVPLYP
jgi:hypothetical protein